MNGYLQDNGDMISEVNAALRNVLKPYLPPKTAIEFGPLGEERTGKGLTFFLYEMHEDPKGNSVMWSDVRDEEGNLIAKQPPVRRFRLSYMVTAWATNSDQEVELLDAALTALTTWVDASLAGGPGSPENADVLLDLDIAHTGVSRQPWEVFEAAQVPMRTSFDLVVTTEKVNASRTDLPRRAEMIDLDAHDKPRPQPQPQPAGPLPPGAAPGRRWKRVPRDRDK